MGRLNLKQSIVIPQTEFQVAMRYSNENLLEKTQQLEQGNLAWLKIESGLLLDTYTEQ